MIRNIKDLAVHAGVPSCFKGDFGRAVERAVYKYTECGCCFDSDEDGVVVAGYAEGADADCQEYRLNYPFTEAEWDTALACADSDGCEMWHEWNDNEWAVVYMDGEVEDE
jgi:hypothetical protein